VALTGGLVVKSSVLLLLSPTKSKSEEIHHSASGL
jgi:hypothetical protein